MSVKVLEDQVNRLWCILGSVIELTVRATTVNLTKRKEEFYKESKGMPDKMPRQPSVLDHSRLVDYINTERNILLK